MRNINIIHEELVALIATRAPFADVVNLPPWQLPHCLACNNNKNFYTIQIQYTGLNTNKTKIERINQCEITTEYNTKLITQINIPLDNFQSRLLEIIAWLRKQSQLCNHNWERLNCYMLAHVLNQEINSI